ncbi:hypothetical protein ACFX2J_042526 [Malus domestica]
MASKVFLQLQGKATQASRVVSEYGSSYYKQVLEKNRHYVQEPPTAEKCSLLSKHLFYTRLASIPGRYETFQKELDSVKQTWKNRPALRVEDAGIAALFGLECFACTLFSTYNALYFCFTSELETCIVVSEDAGLSSLGTGYKGEIERKLSVRPEMDVRNQKQMIILKTVIVNQLYVQIITSKTYKVESKICLTNQSMFTKTLSKNLRLGRMG